MSLEHEIQGGTNQRAIFSGTNGTKCSNAYASRPNESSPTKTADGWIEESYKCGGNFTRTDRYSPGRECRNNYVHDDMLEDAVSPMREKSTDSELVVMISGNFTSGCVGSVEIGPARRHVMELDNMGDEANIYY